MASKPILKKLIIQFLHAQDKLHYFHVKTIELYDVGTVMTKTSIGKDPQDAAERLISYYEANYEFPRDCVVLKLTPQEKKDNK